MIAPLLLGLFLQGTAQPHARALQRPPERPPQQPLETFEALVPAQRREIVEWLRADAAYLDTFQERIRRHALGLSEIDPGFHPMSGKPELYDPKVHAPAQPIPRGWAKGSRARKLEERMFARIPVREAQSIWRYEYGNRRVVRTAERSEPARLFANALVGRPPDWDLAEALVELELDDGSMQQANAAFDHAYTDREGHAYAGVTLYDAWAGGGSIEMPDIDCLGIVHELLDDWKTWKAPVRKQESLYAKIRELYRGVHSYRGLRRALARTFLASEPVLRDGYSGHLDRLHALWDAYDSDPRALAEALPDGEGWMEFWDAWVARMEKEPKLRTRGRARRKFLDRDEARVRALALRILGEFTPTAESGSPTPPPTPEEGRGGDGEDHEQPEIPKSAAALAGPSGS